MTAHLEADPAAIQGYDRFIEQADETKVTPENRWYPHRPRTIERMRAPREGLEGIGRPRTSAVSGGVRRQATRAVTAGGRPLGLLRGAYGSQGDVYVPGMPRGVDGWRDTMKAAEPARAGTRVLAVMDRERDKLAWFDRCPRRGGCIFWCGCAPTAR